MFGYRGLNVYRICEAEAHAFASELLMPEAWITRLLSRMSIENALGAMVAEANVSGAAATYALFRLLPPGLVFAVVETRTGLDNVVYAGRSPDTIGRTPPLDQPLDSTLYDHLAAETGEWRDSWSITRWWRFTATPDPEQVVDADANLALRAIMTAQDVDETQAKSLFGRVNGAISHVYDKKAFASVDELETLIVQTLIHRESLKPLILHDDFRTYVRLKALALWAKRHGSDAS